MWMVNPVVMCRQHLLGEHVECHMFLGHLKLKKSVVGYIENNLFQPKSLKDRHDLLALEMQKRGMNHNSPLNEVDISYLSEEQKSCVIDKKKSSTELFRRCSKCSTNDKPLCPTESRKGE